MTTATVNLDLNAVLREADERLRARFHKYHAEHPEVWSKFEFYALQMFEAGKKQYSAWAIINRIRWDHDVERTEEFKISNDYIALYARCAIAKHPDLKDFFRTRPMKAERRQHEQA